VVGASLLLGACGDATGPGPWPPGAPSPAYLSLLALFPEDAQGLGLDAAFGTSAQQPMTYGLVLMAEGRRLLAQPTEEGRRRVRLAAGWLVAAADLDRDGLPGWGLPDPWDAFADGSVNPADQPYTITTAIVLEGLLDASLVPMLWTGAERAAHRDLCLAVLRRWATEAFTPTPDGGGFFWYSPAAADAYFSLNPSAMLAGATQRFLRRYGAELTWADLSLLLEVADRAARSVALAVRPREGRPFWAYLAVPNPLGQDEPNDAVHHGYILWGMETYRRYGGRVELPWTTAQARASLRAFLVEGAPRDYPQDVAYEIPVYRERPAQLWGAGMLMATMARLGDPAADTVYQAIEATYGPGPRYRLWPRDYADDPAFYPRMAAHLLLGLAERDFARAMR